MRIRVSPGLAGIVLPGVLVLDGVAVLEHDAALDIPLAEAEARVRLAPPPERLAVRAMYRRTGIDPTRKRPS